MSQEAEREADGLVKGSQNQIKHNCGLGIELNFLKQRTVPYLLSQCYYKGFKILSVRLKAFSLSSLLQLLAAVPGPGQRLYQAKR